MNGFLVVNKPAGLTSHDVVARIRRAAHQRRVGHAGTLDPAAEGVLIVCLGPSTRLVDHLMAGTKRYTATIALGATTTTDDAEGEIVEERDASAIARADVERALSEFTGAIRQIPPMYSALKVAGTPLYKLARKGVEIERAAREVTIHSLVLLEFGPRRVVVDVTCSKGTYIRTLARDLGERLGCGAHLAHLLRTASGRFTLEDATRLDELVEGLSSGRAADYLNPPDAALADLDVIVVGAEGERRLVTGSPYRPEVVVRAPTDGAEYRVYTVEGEHIGIATFDAEVDVWRPTKKLIEEPPAPKPDAALG